MGHPIFWSSTGLYLAREPLRNVGVGSAIFLLLIPMVGFSLLCWLLLSPTAFLQAAGDAEENTGASPSTRTARLALASSGSSYGPLKELVLEIPEHAAFATLLRLDPEADAIDVTPLLAFENQPFTYRPQQALQPGEQELRLSEVTPDGQIIARRSWSLFVSGEASIADSIRAEAPFSRSATGRGFDLGELSTHPIAGIVLPSDQNSTSLRIYSLAHLEAGQPYLWWIKAISDNGAVIGTSPLRRIVAAR